MWGTNEEDGMAMLAMAIPIPAGKTEQWKKFQQRREPQGRVRGVSTYSACASGRSCSTRRKAISHSSRSKAITLRRLSQSSESARIHLRCGLNSK